MHTRRRIINQAAALRQLDAIASISSPDVYMHCRASALDGVQACVEGKGRFCTDRHAVSLCRLIRISSVFNWLSDMPPKPCQCLLTERARAHL